MSQPWMPLYIADYLADTGHLTARQSGGYLHLIMHYWRVGCLPKESAPLARIAKMTPHEWSADKSVILAFFDGDLKHSRIESELEASRNRVEASRRNGALGGKAKSLKTKEASLAAATNPLERTASGSVANHNHNHRKEEPRPNIQETSLEGLRHSRPAAPVSNSKALAANSAAEAFSRFWAIWPHKVGKPDAARSFLRVAGEVEQILAGVERYARDKPPDRSWLNPATFLNQRRWEDQPAPVSARAPFERADNGMTTILKEIYENERKQNESSNRDVPRLSVVSSNHFGRPDNA